MPKVPHKTESHRKRGRMTWEKRRRGKEEESNKEILATPSSADSVALLPLALTSRDRTTFTEGIIIIIIIYHYYYHYIVL